MVDREVDAKKHPLSGDAAWEFITGAGAEKIYVATGKKVAEFDLALADRQELLPLITGRTGNLRAPAIMLGKSWYVGFGQEMYDRLW